MMVPVLIMAFNSNSKAGLAWNGVGSCLVLSVIWRRLTCVGVQCINTQNSHIPYLTLTMPYPIGIRYGPMAREPENSAFGPFTRTQVGP
jgi:hypothetical protein